MAKEHSLPYYSSTAGRRTNEFRPFPRALVNTEAHKQPRTEFKLGTSSLSSSLCGTASMDIPDPLSPLLPIVHCLWQVFRATSHILTLNVAICIDCLYFSSFCCLSSVADFSNIVTITLNPHPNKYVYASLVKIFD